MRSHEDVVRNDHNVLRENMLCASLSSEQSKRRVDCLPIFKTRRNLRSLARRDPCATSVRGRWRSLESPNATNVQNCGEESGGHGRTSGGARLRKEKPPPVSFPILRSRQWSWCEERQLSSEWPWQREHCCMPCQLLLGWLREAEYGGAGGQHRQCKIFSVNIWCAELWNHANNGGKIIYKPSPRQTT